MNILKHLFYRTVHIGWLLLLVLLIALALYVSLGRYALLSISDQKTEIADWLSQKLHSPVEIERLKTHWYFLSPSFSLKNVKAHTEPEPVILEFCHIGVDVLRSVLKRRLVLNFIHVDGLNLNVEKNLQGNFYIKGIDLSPSPQQSVQGQANEGLHRILEWAAPLVEQQGFILQNVNLNYLNQGKTLRYHVDRIAIGRIQDQYHIQGSVVLLKEEPVKFLFKSAMHGALFQPHTWNGKFYLNFDHTHIKPWANLVIKPWYAVDQALAQAEVWGQLENGRLSSLLGRVDVENILLQSLGAHRDYRLKKIKTDFHWTQTAEDAWQLALNRFSINAPGWRWPEKDILVQRDENWTLRASNLALDELTNLLQDIPAPSSQVEVLEWLSSARPEGQLQDAVLVLKQLDGQWRDFEFTSYFSDLAVRPTEQTPGFSGLNGFAAATAEQVLAEIESRNFTADIPQLMRAPLRGDTLSAKLLWRKGQGLLSNQITVSTPDVSGTVLLTHHYTHSGKQLRVQARLNDGNGREKSLYLPAKIMPEPLTAWLDRAIVSGHLKEARLLYHGPMERTPYLEKTLQMTYQARQAVVDYLPDWPSVYDAQAEIWVNGREVRVDIDHGKIYGSDILSGRVTVPYFDKGDIPRVVLQAQVAGDAADGIRVLRETPLRKRVDRFIDSVSVSGGMRMDLNVNAPLMQIETDPVQARVDLTLQDNSAAIQDWSLNLEKVNGHFSYDTRSGIQSEAWQAQLLGGLMTGTVKTWPQKSDQMAINITGKGTATMDELMLWSRQPLAELVQGKADYKASLSFYPQSFENPESLQWESRLNLESDLAGVALNLPAPLGKQAQEQVALRYHMTLGAKPRNMNLHYGDRFKAIMQWDETGLSQGNFHFGPLSQPMETLPGISVTGELAHLDLPEWKGLFDRLSPQTGLDGISNANESLADKIRRVDLEIGTTDLFNQKIKDLSVQLMASKAQWGISFNSDNYSGIVRIPKKSPETLIQVEMDKLYLPETGSGNDETGSGKGKVSLSPDSIPPLAFNIKDLRINDEDWGQWSGTLIPDEHQVKIDPLIAHFKQVRLEGHGVWLEKNGVQSSAFTGSATAGDMKQLMEAWGYTPTLVSHKSKLSANLTWPGSPLDFSAQKSEGDLDIKITDGRLLSVDSTTSSSMKVIGLLNLETLSRRLQLDFADLFQKGLAFDQITGNFDLNNAMLYTNNMKIKGPAARFDVKGGLDLKNKTLDQELAVTLPVSRNLVLPAAATGGLPLAATVYLIDQAIGDQLDKITTVRFDVTGPWEDPKVTRRRRRQ